MDRASVTGQRTLLRFAGAAAGTVLAMVAGSSTLWSVQAQPRPVPTAENLAVVDARGGIGSALRPAGQIITVVDGKVTGVVARGLQFPYQGGIAPTADGTSLVFGNETAGVWSVRLDGTGLHRLVATPPSGFRNALGVEHVAWSDFGRIAFAVNTASDVVVNPSQDRGFGIWVMPFHGGRAIDHRPRRVASPAQVGAQTPGSIWSLAWSRDGSRLITSPTNLPSSVVSLDITHGTTRVLIQGGGEAAVSPASGDLAYVTGGLHAGAPASLWIAGAQGRRRRLLVAARTSILHPVWSPDGREIAYIAGSGGSTEGVGGSALHVVTVATMTDRVVLRADQPNRSLLPHGYFADLAWVPILKRS